MFGRIVPAALAASYVITAPPAAAQEVDFDIPAGRLDRALARLATQAGVSINLDDPALRRLQTRGFSGQHSLRAALAILLRGTGFAYRIEDGNIVRLVQRPREKTLSPAGPSAPPAPPTPPRPATPIVVTASKSNTALSEYAGSASTVSLPGADALRFGSRGTEALLRAMPNLASTDLGPGRNKVFIRGIADSSFNGLSQATISQYLGESRLIYSAPDPDLALYDIERVELLEGPQGTLYGAGSLGGVIRLVPREPQLGETSLAGVAGVSATGSELGYDAALVGNAPLFSNTALRIVGYKIRQAGYIDDPSRNAGDINRTKISGLRAVMRFEPTGSIAFDLGFVGQNVASKDGQYTNSDRPTLVRTSAIAQPFDNDYRLWFATIRADWGAVHIVSNSSYTDHAIDSIFDATQSDGIPRQYDEDLHAYLMTHETRLSGSGNLVENWVIGVAAARNINHVERLIGTPDAQAMISDTRSETLDAAMFGEASLALTSRLSITGGARFGLIRQVEELHSNASPIEFEPVRSDWRFLPTAAVSWRVWNGTLLFLRHHEGYRAGAQRITGADENLQSVRYRPDELKTDEIGFRFGTNPGARFRGALSYARSRWDDVQADLVTADGYPYVANIGSGYVHYASASFGWTPINGLDLDLSGFFARSHLDRPAPEYSIAQERDLPNIADSGWHAAGRWTQMIGSSKLTLDASLGYVGKSYLAILPPFDRTQGGYLDTRVGGRVDFGNWGVSLDIDNIQDSRANRFSYGNPFSLAQEEQRTPLRPRTVRIGIDAAF